MSSSSAPEPGSTRRAGAVGALVCLVAGTVVSVLRVPPSLVDGIYAEDGEVFITDWLWNGRWDLVLTPYQGYLHVLPRLASGLVMLLPVPWWGVADTLVACVMVGGVAAGVWLAARALSLPVVVAACVAAIPVLEPLTGVEAVGNVANIHWYVLYLLAWVACAGRRLRRPWVWAVVVLVCCLTEIQSVLLLPVVAVTWWRRRVAWPLVAAWLVGAAAQVTAYLLSARDRTPGNPSVRSIVTGYVGNIVLGGFGFNQRWSRGALVVLGLFPVLGLLIVFLVLAFFVLRRSSNRWLAVVMLVLSVASWWVSVWTNNSIDFVAAFTLFRWGTTASMAFMVVVVLTVAEVRLPRWARVATGVVVLALVLRAFVGVLPDRHGGSPTWQASVEASRAACSTAQYTDVATWPDRWFVRVPCSRV